MALDPNFAASLIQNRVSGYMGLLLGFSVFHLAELLRKTKNLFKNLYKTMVTQ